MSQIVLTLDSRTIEKMRLVYEEHFTNAVPQGALFVAKLPHCTITAYRSGKVMFQGKNGEQEAAKWGSESKSKKKEQSPATTSLPTGFAHWSVIGSDEVGTGDYFGPITVVAAYVDKEQIQLLEKRGVKDSKDLTDEKISKIGMEIKDIIPHSLLVLHNEKYNELQAKGMSQGKMKAMLHNQAIGNVLKKIAPIRPEAILIDQFAEEGVYFHYLKDLPIVHKDNVFFRTKAEGLHIAVAAASILARYAFIQHMDLLSKRAGFMIPKGAGHKVDEAAAQLIREKGQAALTQFTKLHFANTRKALDIFMKD